jgi:hypothetical protein
MRRPDWGIARPLDLNLCIAKAEQSKAKQSKAKAKSEKRKRDYYLE